MSSKLLTKVWHAGYGDASTILLLMALADEANDAGECSVTLPTLAKKARQSERNCQFRLRMLEGQRIVERFVATGRGHVNNYRLCLENLANLDMAQRVKSVHPLPEEISETSMHAGLKGEKGEKGEKVSPFIKGEKGEMSSPFSLPFPPDPPSEDLKTEDPKGKNTKTPQISTQMGKPTKPVSSNRCPSDFMPSVQTLTYRERYPSIDFDEALEAMRDWEFKVPRSDWDAALRTWIRKEAKSHSESAGNQRSPHTQTKYGDPRISEKGLYNMQSTDLLLRKYGVTDDDDSRDESVLPQPRSGR